MQTTAKKDLLEFGLNAKLQYFEKLFLAANDNRKRLKDEVRLITAEDKSRDVARSGISMEERWKVELADAFRYYATPADPVRWRGVNTDDIDLSELEIGRWVCWGIASGKMLIVALPAHVVCCMHSPEGFILMR